MLSIRIIHPAKMDTRIIFDKPCRREVILEGIQTPSQEEIIGVPKGIHEDPVEGINPQYQEDKCR